MDKETKSDIDRLQDELQEMVLDDVREIFSETVIDHAMNPRNVGEMADADGYGSSLGHCGDSIEIWLRVMGNIITEATFWTDGCATTIASGSVATEMIKGKSIAQARKSPGKTFCLHWTASLRRMRIVPHWQKTRLRRLLKTTFRS